MWRFGAVICVLLFWLPRPASAQTTALYLDSQPGDFVGSGLTHDLGPGEGTFSAMSSSPRSVVITFDSFSTPSVRWTAHFTAPAGQVLQPGTYERAVRVISAVDAPGLDVTGGSRGCNRLTGHFEIYEVEFGTSGGVTRFAADFEQHCEDATPALYGAIRFNSTRASTNPFDGTYPFYLLTLTPSPYGFVTGPGIDCGAGGTDCSEEYFSDTSVALSATASPGYVFLGWSTADCVGAEIASVRVSRRRFCSALFDAAPGAGTTDVPDYSDSAFYLDRLPATSARSQRVYIAPAAIRPSTQLAAQVSFSIDEGASSSLSIMFAAPFGQTLAPGVYNYAVSNSSAAGGLPVLSMSGCSSGGRFVVYQIGFTGSTLTSFAADFELRCGSAAEPVAGSIRYFSIRRTLLPFDGAYPTFGLEVVQALGGRVISPGAIDCGGGSADCHETYPAVRTLALEAIPSPGYTFIGWAGSCTGPGASTVVTVTRLQRCIPVFSPSPGSGAAGDPANSVATLFIDAPGSSSGSARSIWLWPETAVSASHFSSSNELSFTFQSSGGNFYSVRMRSPAGPLAPGDYDEAFNSPNNLFPGLTLNDCSVTEGRFRVYEAIFNSSGSPLAFAADFEARCSSSLRPYVVGAIRFNSSRRSLVPFDGEFPIHELTVVPVSNGTVIGTGIDCGPGGHVDCSETFSSPTVVELRAIPAPGYRFVAWGGACSGPQTTRLLISAFNRRCYPVFNSIVPGILSEDPRLAQGSLFLDSDPGGPVQDAGTGARRIWTDGVITAPQFSRTSARLTIAFPNGSSASLEFGAPGSTHLQPGVYENASSAFNTTGPRISLSGSMFRFCSPGPLVGRFVVHEILFESSTSGRIISFAADFEYRCQNAAAALRGSIRMNSSRAVVVPFAGPVTSTYRPPDFSGDGSPDLVWRNSVTGRNAFWFMNGAAMGATPPFSAGADLVVDLDWEIRAVGDMDGDRRGDVIWQHATNGKLAAWLFIGATRVATPLFITLSGSPTEPDLDWKIVGAADMNADGQTDILWRHRVSGALRLWHMRGMEQLETVDLPLVVADSQWQVAGIADMNGDGWPDIVWRHYGNGRMAAWFMIDTFVVSTTMLPTLVSDTQWRLAGVADLDRDGHPDFVWQHLTGGRLAVWYMNGLNPITYGSLTPAVITDPNWRIVGVR